MKLLSRFTTSRLLLLSEVAIQINIIVESAASKPEKNTFVSDQHIKNSIDQSELAIVIASLFIAFSLVIFVKTRYFLAKGAWSVTVVGIILSIGSIILRHYESGLYISDLYYYHAHCYNVTTNLMFTAIFICIPYGFCKTNKYYKPDKKVEPSQPEVPTTTPSEVFTYRPHQDEEWQHGTDGSIEFLPTYFVMKEPPSYRNKSSISAVSNNENVSIIDSDSFSGVSLVLDTNGINNNGNSNINNSVVVANMHTVSVDHSTIREPTDPGQMT